jgi:hypothetical protein
MKHFLIIFCFLTHIALIAQEEEELFSIINLDATKEIKLLPNKMIFTQRAIWGKKGLTRITRLVPLTIENRQKELKMRRIMLKSHQIIGFLTFAGMIAQGVLGGKLYNGDNSFYKTHKNLGKAVSISYFSGAGLSLFSPPPLLNKKTKKLNSIKIHKILASIHLTSMIATNILSKKNKKLHRLAAYTAFGSFTAAMIVFKF